MDTIIIVMVGSWLSVTTALTFVEVRRIRKKMYSDGTKPESGRSA
jgi:hypothetical protein